MEESDMAYDQILADLLREHNRIHGQGWKAGERVYWRALIGGREKLHAFRIIEGGALESVCGLLAGSAMKPKRAEVMRCLVCLNGLPPEDRWQFERP